jgi:hypothetical protein
MPTTLLREEQKVTEPTVFYLVVLQSLKYTLKNVVPNIETNTFPIAPLLPEQNAFKSMSLTQDFQLLVSLRKQFPPRP